MGPPIGDLPMDCSEPGLCEDLETYNDKYGHNTDQYGRRKQVMKHVGLGQNQVLAENALVSAFGNNANLPPRLDGTWGGRAGRSAVDQSRDDRAGRELDEAALKLGLDIRDSGSAV